MLYISNKCSTIRYLSFLDLRLHVSNDWRATDQNMHHGLFPIHHFVRISSITQKSQVAYNSTTHQMTPLLPLMLSFMLKAAKVIATYKLRLHTSIAVFYFVHK